MKSGYFHIAVSLLLVATMAAPASAGSASAPMAVSVSVLSRAVMTVDQPADVVVTSTDLKNGYVDVAVPMTVRVRTNSRSGYVLLVSRVGTSFSAVDLTFDDTLMRVGDQGMVARPYAPQGDTLSVHARLTLAPGTEAGRHALPLTFAASPL